MNQKKQFFFLFCAEIVFQIKDAPGLSSYRMNTVVTSNQNTLHAAQIGKAQQILQMEFIKRMNDPTLEIRDVIILTINPLGLQTTEEFTKGIPISTLASEGNA